MKCAEKTIDLSFVILTWNSEKYIKKCISSIDQALDSDQLRYEIFIVDNGSNDGTIDIVENLNNDFEFELHFIKLKENAGTTYPRNLAIKKARGSYICIMDSDVQILPRTIETLMENLKNDTDVGLVVPMLVYPSGRLQKSTDQFPTVFRKAFRYFFLRKMEAHEENQLKPDVPVRVDYAISALWMTRQDIFQNVGLLDEKIFYSPEDVDFCLRVWKAGYNIIYDPRVKGVHHTQEISRGFRLNTAFFNHIKGLFYYFLKHRYFFKAPNFR